MPRRQIQYNPYEILDQRNNRFNQKKQSEPIMYDPLKERQSKGQKIKEKNIAPAGSLLKVWEGLLELSKDQQPQCQMLSTANIQIFQSLPELPNILQLKGKAKISDVTSHFKRLINEKKLIKGWIIRRGTVGNFGDQAQAGSTNWQENSDKYTKLFDELENTSKAALFNVFQGVTLYLVPITQKTKDFCNEMGIVPETFVQGNQQDENYNLLNNLQQETHIFAVLSQIKQAFNTQNFMIKYFRKLNFLNPEILRMTSLQVQNPVDHQDKRNDRSFSPITSDEEDNPRAQHQTQILQQVKTEEYGQNLQRPIDSQQPRGGIMVKKDEDVSMKDQTEQQPQLIQIKKAKEEDDDVDIDDIIDKFKAKIYDVNTVKDKLMGIIHKVTGEKEQKLSLFLSEMIKDYNEQQNQQMIAEQQIIKQESGVPSVNQPGVFNQGIQQYNNPIPQSYGQIQPQRYQVPPSIPQQNQFIPQQGIPQYRQMNPQPFIGGQGIPQQQIRQLQQPLMSQGYNSHQIPHMGIPQQQQSIPFQQRPPQIYQQQQMGIPPLRPPPAQSISMNPNQMMRPGMIPQQQMGNIPPRLMGAPPYQQQQIRQPPSNQQPKR